MSTPTTPSTPTPTIPTDDYRWATRRTRLAVVAMLKRLPRNVVVAILRTVADSLEGAEE